MCLLSSNWVNKYSILQSSIMFSPRTSPFYFISHIVNIYHLASPSLQFALYAFRDSHLSSNSLRPAGGSKRGRPSNTSYLRWHRLCSKWSSTRVNRVLLVYRVSLRYRAMLAYGAAIVYGSTCMSIGTRKQIIYTKEKKLYPAFECLSSFHFDIVDAKFQHLL